MIRRFFSQAWLGFKGQRAAFQFEEFLFFEIGNPLITLIFYCILAAYSFQTADLSSWVVGNSFLLCVNTCIFSLGHTFGSERYYGRLRSIIVSPVNKLMIVLQRGFFPAVVALVSVLSGFIAGGALFNINFSELNFGLFLLSVAVSMFAASGFGLFISMFGLITDSMHLILNLCSSALILFSGANFPVAQLPFAARMFSNLLPLKRGIQAANLLFHAPDLSVFMKLLAEEMLVGVFYFFLAYFFIGTIERIAIRNAALEIF